MNFDTFMAEVNRHLIRMVGLEHEDLPDYLYWDAWNDGEYPVDVAIDVLEENGYAC